MDSVVRLGAKMRRGERKAFSVSQMFHKREAERVYTNEGRRKLTCREAVPGCITRAD